MRFGGVAYYDAVPAMLKTWSSLATYLSGHKDQKSRSLHRRVKGRKFVVSLHMLMDILPSVAKVSLIFQKQDIDVAGVQFIG